MKNVSDKGQRNFKQPKMGENKKIDQFDSRIVKQEMKSRVRSSRDFVVPVKHLSIYFKKYWVK